MKADMILIRYGELTLKGKNRSHFEKTVVDHIRRALQPYPAAALIRTHGRLFVELNGEPYEPIAERLGKIFGLSSFSPVVRAEADLAAMRAAALRAMKDIQPSPATFKVNVRRADKRFPYDSRELNHLIASHVLRHMDGLKVDVHDPEVELRVEVREEGAYIFSEVVRGLGGFPLGTSGKAMLMLSGGIDSPVAGWMAMRRGIRLEAVHFHSYPFTSERAKQKVIDLAYKLAEYADEIRLHLVPFTDIQTRLKQECPDHLLITLMRRAMVRITEKLAEKHRALAIVTGENLGQVASQTLASLNVIGRAARLPILQPLIAMDKDDIIRMAEKIGTFDISILPYEDCCTIFVPKHPSTNPNLRVVERFEQRCSWLEEAMQAAADAAEVMTLQEGGAGRTPVAAAFNELL